MLSRSQASKKPTQLKYATNTVHILVAYGYGYGYGVSYFSYVQKSHQGESGEELISMMGLRRCAERTLCLYCAAIFFGYGYG